ncbi:hypothetical protein AGOR_G00015220 [Albula goreensis]|uniref:Uncharacterized protein n=1 Tax=Albula goreensis TaxID=1534307 RepID=A0A8T3E7T6_9TELE|nr:hypothetical protein AGOR_G00015220 [Albula goreensis]
MHKSKKECVSLLHLTGLSTCPMSAGGGLASRGDQVQGAARYDPVCDQRYNEPPPLPADSPVGPAFDPSGSEESYSGIELKPVHRFIPDSWKNFFRGSRGSRKPWSLAASDNNHTNSSSEGKICSPPHSHPSSSIPGSSTSRTRMGPQG